ncbi:MAG: hypothetical protein MZW92_46525 [Comamonadaceae bacterium]|nr:hypothetical protein [Comamonadaceae bacterium]
MRPLRDPRLRPWHQRRHDPDPLRHHGLRAGAAGDRPAGVAAHQERGRLPAGRAQPRARARHLQHFRHLVRRRDRGRCRRLHLSERPGRRRG